MKTHFLSQVFEPASVAIIGASERDASVGGQVLRNLLASGFSGSIFPINPNYSTVQGLPCYPSITAVDHAIDLVVIAIPSPAIRAVMRDCGEQGVGAVIVISAGFAERGAEGLALQDDIVDIARTYDMPLIGPNCLGVMRPHHGVNLTFAKSAARDGHVALVAQSGAFCTALLDWADLHGYGFSTVASLGATADVGFGDVLDYLAMDPRTKSILLYIEGVTDARSFMSGLRVAARLKPVIVVKSGRTDSGTRAAVSHTGALAIDDSVFDAAIERAGAVRVKSVAELFSAAQVLASGTRVEGPRLAILTNGGGPGVMAADRAHDIKVPLAELSAETLAQLHEHLPPYWSHSNPIDILGDATPEHYRLTTETLLADPNIDGVLVLLTPQAMTDPTACAEAIAAAKAASHKPLLACWMGETLVQPGRSILSAAGIPHFRSPEAGVEAFGYLACYRRNQKTLLQTPAPLLVQPAADVEGARLIIQHALKEKRPILNNAEAKAVLQAFHIPCSPSLTASTAMDALVAAERVGLPVAMKINSPDITHKSDVGGVRLNIREARSVGSAFNEMLATVRERQPDARLEGVTIEPMIERPFARELIVGIATNPVFGPVISFGTGGTAVEIFEDTRVALPPLNDYLGRQLIRSTKAAKLLGQFRNLPAADLEKLIDILHKVSDIACELPEVCELDINPVLLDDKDLIAVDARIVVHTPQTRNARYGHMAIHPYPHELISTWQLSDSTKVSIRPIRPEDAKIEQDFVSQLSPESRYFRFMQSLDHLTPLMLARFTQIDYDREMALIAVINDGQADALSIGVGRYIINPDQKSCEFALTVADAWQRQGLGRELMQRLMVIARDRGLKIMEGDVLSNNTKMLKICESLGFRMERDPNDSEITRIRRHLD